MRFTPRSYREALRGAPDDAENARLRVALREAEEALRDAARDMAFAQTELNNASPAIRACEIGLGLGEKAKQYEMKADDAQAALARSNRP